MKALELGFDFGYSSITIARLLPPEGRLISLDWNEISKRVIEFAGLKDKCDYYYGGLEWNIAKLKREMGEMDFIFIHNDKKDLYLKSLQLLEKKELLKQGTVVIGYNVMGIPAYREYLENSYKYKTKEIDTQHKDSKG